MARSAAKRETNAAVDGRAAGRRTPAPPRQPQPEDLMFFPRLRRRAKWVFVFLALVFGLGFVVLGVGSSLPGTGIADLLQGGAGTTNEKSVNEARDAVRDNPRDADAQLELSRAYQREGRTDEAIQPLERYLELRPNDENVLQELAGLYTSQARRYQDEALAARAEVQEASGLGLFAASGGGLGEALRPGQLDELLINDANQRFTSAAEKTSQAYLAATRTYRRLTRVAPRVPDYYQLLALTAEPAGDYRTALGAYRRYLELSPDAADAQYVRQKITQLQAFTKQTQQP